MKEIFTYINITPDAVDFGGQLIYRPDGVGVIQWIDFWQMAKDCRETIADLHDRVEWDD